MKLAQQGAAISARAVLTPIRTSAGQIPLGCRAVHPDAHIRGPPSARSTARDRHLRDLSPAQKRADTVEPSTGDPYCRNCAVLAGNLRESFPDGLGCLDVVPDSVLRAVAAQINSRALSNCLATCPFWWPTPLDGLVAIRCISHLIEESATRGAHRSQTRRQLSASIAPLHEFVGEMLSNQDHLCDAVRRVLQEGGREQDTPILWPAAISAAGHHCSSRNSRDNRSSTA